VSTATEVAIVGLGRMGQAVAERLLEVGHRVTVWNRSPEPAARLVERGARVVGAPADVWLEAPVAITFLADDQAVEAVCLGPDGLLDRTLGGGSLLVEMSTISPDCSAKIAGGAAAAGVAYLRAPVSGNPVVVRAGNLGIIVSGDRRTFDEALPLLSAIGPKVFHVGGGEEARIVKLALNAMIAGTMGLLAEAILLCETLGLDRRQLLEVAAASAIGSPFVAYKTQPLIDRDYTATFSTVGMAKDLTLALDAAATALVALPVTALVAEQLHLAEALGMGHLDMLALLPLLQDGAGRPTDVPIGARSRR
jgi:3-hydroxyisobutyrate dehydrogenase-like beta-hydroxyacid dehydrogenase